MGTVTVSPEEFHLVLYDGAEIASIVGALADKVGLGDKTGKLGRLRNEPGQPNR